jgi:hypothetical protein
MNSLQGAVTFEAEGVQMYLRISTNAMVRYQDASGETFLRGLMALKRDPSDMKRIRGLVYAALSHMPDITPERAGDIMDAVGILEMAKLVSEASDAAFPKSAPGNVPGAQVERPQTTVN